MTGSVTVNFYAKAGQENGNKWEGHIFLGQGAYDPEVHGMCSSTRTSFFWGGKFREVLQFKKKLRDEGARKGPWEGARWKFEMNS